MQLDLVEIIDWLARIALGASLARVALHWLKGGLGIWIEPGASFWGWFDKLEATLGWLSVSLQKFGKKEQVAAESIKDLLEHPPKQEFNVTVEPKEEKPH